jgi:HAMP domain-containing protein
MTIENTQLLVNKITTIVFIIAIAGTVYGWGYNYRQVEELRIRVDAIEARGTINAQITANDVNWIKATLSEIKEQLNRHMESTARIVK